MNNAVNSKAIGCSKVEIENGVLKKVPRDFVGHFEVSDDIISIGDSAFYGCKGLTSVTIPNSVKFIKDGAFCGCVNLISVDIPNSVTSIGRCAIIYCKSLTSVTIPSSVTDIEVDSLSGYSHIKTIYVPKGSIERFQSLFKDDLKDKIIELPY